MPRRILPLLMLTLMPAFSAQAAYITDKLLVGLYESLENFGKPIKILSSGTAVEILERQRGYIKVKLNDGSIGWVELRYVTDDAPSQAKLTDLEKENKLLQRNLEKAKADFDELKKRHEGVDKVKATNKELEDSLSKSNQRVTELEEQLKLKNDQVKTLGEENYSGKDSSELQGKIQELEAKLLQSQVKLAKRTSMEQEAVFAENDALRERMEKASALLKVDDKSGSPAKEQEAEGLPIWVYLMLLLTLITGIVAGFALFDLRSRRRFGGLGL